MRSRVSCPRIFDSFLWILTEGQCAANLRRSRDAFRCPRYSSWIIRHSKRVSECHLFHIQQHPKLHHLLHSSSKRSSSRRFAPQQTIRSTYIQWHDYLSWNSPQKLLCTIRTYACRWKQPNSRSGGFNFQWCPLLLWTCILIWEIDFNSWLSDIFVLCHGIWQVNSTVAPVGHVLFFVAWPSIFRSVWESTDISLGIGCGEDFRAGQFCQEWSKRNV